MFSFASKQGVQKNKKERKKPPKAKTKKEGYIKGLLVKECFSGKTLGQFTSKM